MPDFRTLVRKEIAPLGLPSDREQKVVEELSAQIEELHASIVASGLSGDAAVEETLRRIPSWAELRRELLAAEPFVKLAHPDHPPLPGATKRALVSRFLRLYEAGFFMELRASLRRLWRSRGYTVTAVLTLAVCLGANAAIFDIVNGVLLNPLSRVAEPHRIMLMANQFPNAGAGISDKSAPKNYFDRLEGVPAFSEQAMFIGTDRVVAVGERSLRVHGMEATPSLFRLVRASPALGRTFTEQEGETGNEQRVILSHGMWQERYAGDPGVLGDELRLDGVPFTIVGVMPEAFSFFDPEARFWIPLAFNPLEQQNGVANAWYNIGRLAPGATRRQAQAQVDAVNRAFLESAPGRLRTTYENAGYHTTVEPLEDVLVRGFSQTLYLLWAGATVVLLIGGINLANLTLARAQSRGRELATRMAIGAGRYRLTAVLLAEGLAVAVGGALLGLVLGFSTLRIVRDAVASQLVLADDFRMDPIVIVYVLMLALMTGAALGIASTMQLPRSNIADSLQQNARTGARTNAGWLRRSLVTSQVALTFVLLTIAALLLFTVRNLLSVDTGYSVDNVMTARINVPAERYPGVDAVSRFLDEALSAVRGVPGVSAAGASTAIPLSGDRGTQAVITEDNPLQGEESILAPTRVGITPGFFETMGTAVVRGRDLDSRDVEAAVARDRFVPRAAIVDETMARTFWPAEDALGKRMFLPGVSNGLVVRDDTRWLTVVGVVPDLLLERLSGSASSVGTFFTPYAEANANDPPRDYGFVIKTLLDPEAVMDSVRQVIAEIDPELALFDVQAMVERSARSVARERLAMFLTAAFAAIALFLSALGVYGVLLYLVAQRQRELGIRIALGSTAGGIFGLILREGARMVTWGLLIGVAVVLLLRPALASQVYGIGPNDPLVTIVIAFILLVAAFLACLAPAYRATSVDPALVLSSE